MKEKLKIEEESKYSYINTSLIILTNSSEFNKDDTNTNSKNSKTQKNRVIIFILNKLSTSNGNNYYTPTLSFNQNINNNLHVNNFNLNSSRNNSVANMNNLNSFTNNLPNINNNIKKKSKEL